MHEKLLFFLAILYMHTILDTFTGRSRLEVGMVIEIHEQVNHEEAIDNAIDTKAMVEVTYNPIDKIYEKLQNLNFCDSPFPGGRIIREQSG